MSPCRLLLEWLTHILSIVARAFLLYSKPLYFRHSSTSSFPIEILRVNSTNHSRARVPFMESLFVNLILQLIQDSLKHALLDGGARHVRLDKELRGTSIICVSAMRVVAWVDCNNYRFVLSCACTPCERSNFFYYWFSTKILNIASTHFSNL